MKKKPRLVVVGGPHSKSIQWKSVGVPWPEVTFDHFDGHMIALIYDAHNDEPVVTVRFDDEGRVTSWCHYLDGVEIKP